MRVGERTSLPRGLHVQSDERERGEGRGVQKLKREKRLRVEEIQEGGEG
mgnify:CR=1 FL=1